MLAVLAVVVAAYSNVFSVPFVWDDHELVGKSLQVSTPGTLRQALVSDLAWGSDRGSSPYYRPVVTLSFALDRSVWGANPAGFHLTNLLIHVGVCTLLFLLVSRSASPLVAASATLLFGVFPRLTEAVTWVSGRGDLLAAAGVLGALYASQALGSRWCRGPIVALALLAGMLSKETGIAGAVAVALLAGRPDRSTERTAEAGGARHALISARLLGYLRSADLMAVSFACLAYLGLRMAAVGGSSLASTTSLGLWGTTVQLVESLGTLTWMALSPWAACLQIGAVGSFDPWLVTLGLATAAAVLLGISQARRCHCQPRLLRALLAASVVALLPALWVAATRLEADAADRYLYLPLATSLAAAATWCAGGRRRPRLVAISGLVVGVILAGVTHSRNRLWGDELDLWLHDAASASPYSSVVHESIADVYFARGSYPEAYDAVAAGLRSLDLQARDLHIERRASRSTLSGKMAYCLFEMGNYQRAAQAFEHLGDVYPEDPLHLLNLARVAAADLDFDRAEHALVRHARRFPASSSSRNLASLVTLGRRLSSELPPPTAGEDLAITVSRARLFTLVHRVGAADDEWWRVATAPGADLVVLGEATAFLATRGRLERGKAALDRLAALGLPEAQLEPIRRLLAEREATALASNAGATRR